MAGTLKRLAGPVALTTTYGTNIYNPASGIIGAIRQIHIANKGAANDTFRLFIGLTGGSAAGTEIAYNYPIEVGAVVDLYWPAGLKLTSSDFLTGGAGLATSLTITVTGDEQAA